MTVDIWSIDRIRTLTKVEVINLRENALSKGRVDIATLCDDVLSENFARPNTRKSTNRSKPSFNIPATAGAEITKLLLKLPNASTIQNAQNRIKWLANPTSTFTGLWRHYVSCAFSSQMKSDPDTPLGRFANGDSPLLDLQSVIDYGTDTTWFESELRIAGLNRMRQKNVEILKSGRNAFAASRGHDDLLKNGRPDAGLGVFIDLASDRVSDRNIETSAAFSASIEVDELHGIGNKQIRNILVNTGLAHNVLPIDSRWKNYVNGRMHFEPSDLQNARRYLAIEDVIRQALLLVLSHRRDIPNLAVLDSVVFAVQSTNGPQGGEWAGGRQ
jgi:hypothetical protein